jgi:hypothetical protein
MMRSSPQIQPGHLLNLIDDVGIIQHAYGTIPNRSTGYCVDDVARLVIAVVHLEHGYSDPAYRRILASALAFLFHAWGGDAPGMHNFMDYRRRWQDALHAGDHLGRTVWALGVVIADEPVREEAAPCLRLLADMQPCLEGAATPREMAYTIVGLTRPDLSALPASLQRLLDTLADRLSKWYDEHRREGWLWFENALTYDNARLPQAMIAAGARLGKNEISQRGLEALDWYADQCTIEGDTIRLVGNRWRRADDPAHRLAEEGDEQPIDAAALTEALIEAWKYTGDGEYAHRAVRTFEWFLGRNSQGLPVYDFVSGGCHDGLGPAGLNPNEGAESTLAYLQALLALENAGLQSCITRPE